MKKYLPGLLLLAGLLSGCGESPAETELKNVRDSLNRASKPPKKDSVLYRAQIEVYNPTTDTLDTQYGVALFLNNRLKRFALFGGKIWNDSLFLNTYRNSDEIEDMDLTVKGGQHFTIKIVGGKSKMTASQREFTKSFAQSTFNGTK